MRFEICNFKMELELEMMLMALITSTCIIYSVMNNLVSKAFDDITNVIANLLYKLIII